MEDGIEVKSVAMTTEATGTSKVAMTEEVEAGIEIVEAAGVVEEEEEGVSGVIEEIEITEGMKVVVKEAGVDRVGDIDMEVIRDTKTGEAMRVMVAEVITVRIGTDIKIETGIKADIRDKVAETDSRIRTIDQGILVSPSEILIQNGINRIHTLSGRT